MIFIDSARFQINIPRMQKILSLSLAVLLGLLSVSGCCNTCFKKKQLKDDVHSYFLDGDPEALSEAEPDNSI